MIESLCPIARSYAEVEKLCVDSWTCVTRPFLMSSTNTTDEESLQNLRAFHHHRYRSDLKHPPVRPRYFPLPLLLLTPLCRVQLRRPPLVPSHNPQEEQEEVKRQ
jgi:hypothetical protein